MRSEAYLHCTTITYGKFLIYPNLEPGQWREMVTTKPSATQLLRLPCLNIRTCWKNKKLSERKKITKISRKVVGWVSSNDKNVFVVERYHQSNRATPSIL